MGASIPVKKHLFLFCIATILIMSERCVCREVSPLAQVVTTKRAGRVCGNELAMLINQICQIYRTKRSIFSPSIASQEQPESDYYDADQQNVAAYEFPFTNRLAAGMIVPTLYKGKRTWYQKTDRLATECCHKPNGCAYSEMIGYCDGKGNFNGMGK